MFTGSVENKKLSFFHKRLVQIGGAEKLLVSEVNELAKQGVPIDVVSFYIDDIFKDLFSDINIIELGSRRKDSVFSYIFSLFRFLFYCFRNRNSHFLCASGYFEMAVAGLFCRIDYSLEDHHPITMLPVNTVRSAWQLRSKIDKNYNRLYEYQTDNGDSSSYQLVTSVIAAAKYSIVHYPVWYFLFKNAARIFVLSEYARNEKQLLFGVRCDILSGGVDDVTFSEESLSNPSLDRKTIVSLSRLSNGKRLDALLVAFANSGLHAVGYNLKICGIGPAKDELVKLANELSIQNHVIFHGFVDEEEIYNILYNADIFVNSQFADYNITLIEALAVDSIVLTSDVSYIDPVVEEEACIVRTNVLSVSDFSDAICECAVIKHDKNPERMSRLVIDRMGYKRRAAEIIKLLKL